MVTFACCTINTGIKAEPNKLACSISIRRGTLLNSRPSGIKPKVKSSSKTNHKMSKIQNKLAKLIKTTTISINRSWTRSCKPN